MAVAPILKYCNYVETNKRAAYLQMKQMLQITFWYYNCSFIANLAVAATAFKGRVYFSVTDLQKCMKW